MFSYQVLEVEDHFQLTGQGLVVMPDFSVPNSGKWIDFNSKANVVSPSGHQATHKIHIGITHFNIPDLSVSIDKRWRVIVCFPEAKKEEIPIGSKVYVSESDYEIVVGKNT